MRDHVDALTEDELREDRGAFFGSILATLDHILWADRLWVNRVDPKIRVPDSPDEDTDRLSADWSRERAAFDQQLIDWTETLSNADMQGEVVWDSKIFAKTFRNPRGLAIMHMFNHQTHHRGQVHAMLTGMGRATMDTDIVFMPET
ncbi:DinB family protein [Octadecabacter sp. CECT 8868]|nr:DinB family protein [Octadecabacter algicola]